jgi:hypothetical protein
MGTDMGPDLKRRFEAAFYLPARHRWESARGRADWQDLEAWQDALAGPLYAITETGGCAYAYLRDDAYFRGVDGPVALRDRLRHWHDELVEGIGRFVPTSPAEAADLVTMRQFAADIWAVTEAACEIEQDRWAATRDQA